MNMCSTSWASNYRKDWLRLMFEELSPTFSKLEFAPRITVLTGRGRPAAPADRS
uniref:Uncharacterized protein n=1 Tax=Fagus sylvatica TaxID=28930 RepID=A0A2N9GAC5_FAGSY